MTAAQLTSARREFVAASRRAERATWYGDRAGALIAQATADALRRRIVDAMEPTRHITADEAGLHACHSRVLCNPATCATVR